MNDDAIAKMKAGFERIRKEAEAWKTLGISEKAPTPERQEALNRAIKTTKFLLRAMRTLANPEAEQGNVQLATALVDEAWRMFGEGPASHSASMLLLEYIERGALEGIDPIGWLAHFFPGVAQRVDRDAVDRAVRARVRGRFDWDVNLEALRSAGLEQPGTQGRAPRARSDCDRATVNRLRQAYARWKARSLVRSLRTRRKQSRA